MFRTLPDRAHDFWLYGIRDIVSQLPRSRRRRRSSSVAQNTLAVLPVFIRLCVLLVATIVVVQGCLLQTFYVPSSSMSPTLQESDCLVVPKFAYGLHVPFFDASLLSWGSPERGHVVVFHRDDDPLTLLDESSQALVKRVIGIAGDTVTFAGDRVFVNGRQLSEPYVRGGARETSSVTSFAVPAGKVFLLGDNRDESFDSRLWTEPFVPVVRVVGPASVVYWSARQSARVIY